MAIHRKGSGAAGTPSLAEYINASNEAYNQPGISTPVMPSYPGNLTILQTKVKGKLQDVYSYNEQDGFYAVAFKTPENQVVIAYEGTNLFTGSAQFTAGQVVDDADIVAGQVAPAFTDALQFQKTALAAAAKNGIHANNVFVTGHSLGAAESEYVSARTGISGTTFGTPGISTNTPGLGKKSFTGPTAHLTNYVEIGDPVGNYAIDNTPIPDIVKSTSPTNQHYGTTNFIGYTNLTSIAAYGSLVAANTFYQGGTEEDVAAAAAAYAAAVPDHFLSEYAYDLGVSLGGPDHSYGANVNCFAQGTRIATSRGDVPVEELAVGDLVVTVSGARRAIRWLGHREIATEAGMLPWNSRPIRILAGAFGAGLPTRDLLLSPGHPVLVGADEDGAGGVLVPVMCLVNGTTVDRVAVDSVTYWHVELATHDILLAEGLAAESYLDGGDRAFFGGVDDPLADPDLVLPGQGGRCRPVAIDGAAVAAERDRLDAVFASRLAAACAWPETVAG